MGDVEGGITLGNGTKATGLAQAAIDAICDVDGQHVTVACSPTAADHVGELVTLNYSRVDANGDLREVRIVAAPAAGVA